MSSITIHRIAQAKSINNRGPYPTWDAGFCYSGYMPDNVIATNFAGKTITVPHSEDFDESQSQVDESFGSVTFGSDGKVEVAARFKTALLEHYPEFLTL